MNFQVGDRVRVVGAGEFLRYAAPGATAMGKIVEADANGEPFWRVELDGSGERFWFAPSELRRISRYSPGDLVEILAGFPVPFKGRVTPVVRVQYRASGGYFVYWLKPEFGGGEYSYIESELAPAPVTQPRKFKPGDRVICTFFALDDRPGVVSSYSESGYVDVRLDDGHDFVGNPFPFHEDELRPEPAPKSYHGFKVGERVEVAGTYLGTVTDPGLGFDDRKFVPVRLDMDAPHKGASEWPPSSVRPVPLFRTFDRVRVIAEGFHTQGRTGEVVDRLSPKDAPQVAVLLDGNSYPSYYHPSSLELAPADDGGDPDLDTYGDNDDDDGPDDLDAYMAARDLESESIGRHLDAQAEDCPDNRPRVLNSKELMDTLVAAGIVNRRKLRKVTITAEVGEAVRIVTESLGDDGLLVTFNESF